MRKGIKDSKRRNEQEKKHRKIAKICGLIFVCFLFVYGVIYAMLYHQVNKQAKEKICEGVFIGRTNVSGMNEKQALNAVDRQAKLYEKQKIFLLAGDKKTEVLLGELGFDIFKEEDLIKNAIDYGKKGNVFSRYIEIKDLKKKNKVLKPVYQIEKEKAKKVLTEKLKGILPKAVDATIARKDGAFVLTKDQQGKELNSDKTIDAINRYLNKDWNGKEGKIEVVSDVKNPRVQKKDLESIKDPLGTFSTYCGSGQTRVVNIKNGVQKIHGSVIMPGEEFSVGKAMQPFEKSNGYVEAGAFENGELVQSIAGGICQVSTTLYNAVIESELEVTSRQPHSMTVSYVKPSRDAAIAGNYKDFRFKNNLQTPIFIEGYVANGNVVFTIYGKETRKADRKVEYISEVISTEAPKKKYVAQTGAAIGYLSEKKGTHKGMIARLWKVVYEGGKEVSRDIFNKSSYNPSVTTVSVGTASTNPAYTKQIQDAIRTQDESRIRTAIADVKAKEAAAQVPIPTPQPQNPTVPQQPVPPTAPQTTP
ncbi:VanW family protein [Faecalimonas sp.]